MSTAEDCLLILIAIFLPPLVVLIKRGCGLNFCLNILLTLLGWIPGILHAWLIIATSPRRRVVYRSTNYPTTYGGPGYQRYHRRTYSASRPRRRYYY
ncbi:uncharacterized protein J3D65DRAFT_23912 [Phyllosticta citribraziliensis]|uniref:Plasma membrane proteolipid 3 n=1 Tax=Phyllosticta citribraziliensis TaxID=989973 RepID=A0ABR1M9J1_9PEZI